MPSPRSRAIELLALHTSAKGAARIAFNMAMLEADLRQMKAEGDGWPQVAARMSAERRAALRPIEAVIAYCTKMESRELIPGADGGDGDCGDADEPFFGPLNAALIPLLETLIDRLNDDIAYADLVSRKYRRATRGQSPLPARLDVLTDLWGEHGGSVTRAEKPFVEFLKVGAHDLFPGDVAMEGAIRSAVTRYNRRHHLQARRGRPKIAREGE